MRRNAGVRGHAIADAFVFMLLGVFALLSTTLVLIGAQAYMVTTNASDEHNTERILHAYIFNAVRGDDASGSMLIEDVDGVETLAVFYDYGDQYVKRIYCYEGELREYFARVDYEFDPESGDPICAAKSFAAQIDGDLMTVTMTDDDEEAHTVQIALRTMR